jgi:hypothetical protein
MSIYCLHCSSIISHPKKFCNSSCAAKHNNKGVRRHGNFPGTCKQCDTILSRKQIFCSKNCSATSRKKNSTEIKKNNAARQSRYRAKQYRIISPNADQVKIKDIYLNCPEGHEVDHIIPLSRGGLHHEDNLQYLLKEDNRRKGNKVVGDPGYDPSHHAVMSSRPSHLAHPPH